MRQTLAPLLPFMGPLQGVKLVATAVNWHQMRMSCYKYRSGVGEGGGGDSLSDEPSHYLVSHLTLSVTGRAGAD